MGPEAAERLARRFGVPAFASVKEMMERARPEVVGVATSWGQHYEPTVRVLRAGAHVLCEKPLAEDSATAAKMVRAAEEAGRRLALDFNYRFMYTTEQVRRLLQEGALGILVYLYWRLTIGNPADFNPYCHLVALPTHSSTWRSTWAGGIAGCRPSLPSQAVGRTTRRARSAWTLMGSA